MPDLGWVVIALVSGTLPSPWLVARALGRGDVIAEMRRSESPSDAHFLIGRKIGKAAVAVAVILDMAKGFVPALFAVRAGLEPAVIAWVGVAAVAGHSFAPFLRETAGRGLSAAAGVALAVIPRAMVATGLIAVAGMAVRRGGQGTSVGFYLMPLFAWALGYPGALALMALGIAGLIAVRRLEGLPADRRDGVALGPALVARLFRDLPKGRAR